MKDRKLQVTRGRCKQKNHLAAIQEKGVCVCVCKKAPASLPPVHRGPIHPWFEYTHTPNLLNNNALNITFSKFCSWMQFYFVVGALADLCIVSSSFGQNKNPIKPLTGTLMRWIWVGILTQFSSLRLHVLSNKLNNTVALLPILEVLLIKKRIHPRLQEKLKWWMYFK